MNGRNPYLTGKIQERIHFMDVIIIPVEIPLRRKSWIR